MTKTYRIKSRTRFTCFVTLTIILITILANFALGFSTASSLTVPQYEEIRIQSGDTLWDIAGRYTDNSQDIRSAIHEICQINDISASELYAGMTIKVRIYHTIAGTSLDLNICHHAYARYRCLGYAQKKRLKRKIELHFSGWFPVKDMVK